MTADVSYEATVKDYEKLGNVKLRNVSRGLSFCTAQSKGNPEVIVLMLKQHRQPRNGAPQPLLEARFINTSAYS